MSLGRESGTRHHPPQGSTDWTGLDSVGGRTGPLLKLRKGRPFSVRTLKSSWDPCHTAREPQGPRTDQGYSPTWTLPTCRFHLRSGSPVVDLKLGLPWTSTRVGRMHSFKGRRGRYDGRSVPV